MTTEIAAMVETLKLTAEKTRLTILLLLREKELCVCELVDLLQTSQPNISQHMRKLKHGGLVKEAKRGQWVYYSLAAEDKPFLTELLNHLPPTMSGLAQRPANRRSCCD
ncbi:metalloregulator ArsR/SmtB family transcription factor [Paenibacillus sp. JX-17]|uniref:Metalloregulator ArsR/SmtB family transcription factor n=1 Tax=Paenibacillus lacisoli TaxID=3064525 RepID=A0ABT9CJC1_9BACL|nr:metalloregulator ArsR/SmtB family transcription factor [Paenibacillus sp. JX-17]MDO7908724.1 metalloregulator ArsR/SmtB family transcription factor [Paenibacillus sp. JX-17]